MVDIAPCPIVARQSHVEVARRAIDSRSDDSIPACDAPDGLIVAAEHEPITRFRVVDLRVGRIDDLNFTAAGVYRSGGRI